MNTRSYIVALIIALVIAAVGVAAVVVAAQIAYDEGFLAGRRDGREEAFKVSGVNAYRNSRDISVTVTLANVQGDATPLPLAEQTRTFHICDTLPVTTTEVLVREEPGLTAPVSAALPQGTAAGVICSSENMIESVSWVQVVAEQTGAPTVIGWIPGQDIDYPPVCMQGRVKPKELLLRETDWVGADVVRAIPGGTDVGVICNSARGLWGKEYWVRVKLVMDGEIVLGWAPANDVL
jgi:hypothetical protein